MDGLDFRLFRMPTMRALTTDPDQFAAVAATNPDTRRITLHEQVFNRLRERILTGDYAPHQQLPSEACLMRSFDVSRVTVRQALKDLVAEGLIYSQQGMGFTRFSGHFHLASKPSLKLSRADVTQR
jgi:DNA-binding FadR family transcriptional regulator